MPYGITVLAATRHRWTCPTLTTARRDGTRFTYPARIESWVDLGIGYIYVAYMSAYSQS